MMRSIKWIFMYLKAHKQEIPIDNILSPESFLFMFSIYNILDVTWQSQATKSLLMPNDKQTIIVFSSNQ